MYNEQCMLNTQLFEQRRTLLYTVLLYRGSLEEERILEAGQ